MLTREGRTLHELARSMEWDRRDTRFERLTGGLAHESYVAEVAGERYVVKFLHEDFGPRGIMIPLDQLIHNTRAAGEAGAGARLVRAFPEAAIIVLEFIEGRTLTKTDLSTPHYIPCIAAALRRLHTLAPPFAADKTIFSILDGCLELLRDERVEVPPGFLDHLPTAARIRTALMSQALPFAPCNNDAYAPNFIDQDGTVRIIDYDYSGMNDPCFDLGDLTIEGGFTPDQVEALCESYFRVRRPVQVARTRLFGITAQFTWTLLMAAADQTIDAKPDPCYDYGAEGLARWAQVRPQLEAAELERLLIQAQADE